MTVRTTRCHSSFCFHSFDNYQTHFCILINRSILMNITEIFNNYTLSITTIRSIRKYYRKNPFDSWYIGGILFMCTIMLVLLYANYYRENACQILWIRLLTKLRIIQPSSSSSIPSPLYRAVDSLAYLT